MPRSTRNIPGSTEPDRLGVRRSLAPMQQEDIPKAAKAMKGYHAASCPEVLVLIEASPDVRRLAEAGYVMTTDTSLKAARQSERLDDGSLRAVGGEYSEEKFHSLRAHGRAVWTESGEGPVRVGIDTRDHGTIDVRADDSSVGVVGRVVWVPNSLTVGKLQEAARDERAAEVLRRMKPKLEDLRRDVHALKSIYEGKAAA